MPCIEKGTNIRHVLHQTLSISALPEHPFFGDVSVAQLVASMSGVVCSARRCCRGRGFESR